MSAKWIAVAAALAGCAGGADVPMAGKSEPATWLAGEPNAWAAVDLKGLRADPTYGPVLQCKSAPPRTSTGISGSLAALPCRAALEQSERADLWVRREESGAQSELLVFHHAEAGATCLDTEAKGAPLGPALTEAVRTGSRWPRIYVVRGPRGAEVVFPTGVATARTRDALVRGVEPPTADALPGGVLVRSGGDSALLQILANDLPSNATLNLGGLKAGELTVESTAKNPGSASYSVRVRFDFSTQADRLGPAFTQIADELRKRGHAVELSLIDSWSYLAHVRSPIATVAPPCEASK